MDYRFWGASLFVGTTIMHDRCCLSRRAPVTSASQPFFLKQLLSADELQKQLD